MQPRVQRGEVCRMLYFARGRQSDVIRRSVRVQVENTVDTNYPFLHGIIASGRDNGVHARVARESFTKITCQLDGDES